MTKDTWTRRKLPERGTTTFTQEGNFICVEVVHKCGHVNEWLVSPWAKNLGVRFRAEPKCEMCKLGEQPCLPFWED